MITNPDIRPGSIAFVATTFYKDWYSGPTVSLAHTDKVRGDLALDFCRFARERGHPIVIADNPTSVPEFKRELTKTGAIVLERTVPQRAAGKRLAIQKAASLDEVKAIIRSEPEKVDLVNHALTIAEPLVNNQADICVPGRVDSYFAKYYPDYMYASEVEINKKFNQVLQCVGLSAKQLNLDIAFGPTALRNDPNVVSLFMKIYTFWGERDFGVRKYANPEDGSNAQIYPVVEGLFRGFRVTGRRVPFIYSETQRLNETIQENIEDYQNKRRAQKGQTIVELVHFLRFLIEEDKRPEFVRKSRLAQITLN